MRHVSMNNQENFGCLLEEISVFNRDRCPTSTVQVGNPLTIRFLVRITEDIFFDPTFRLSFIRMEDERVVYSCRIGEDGWDISWLPRGSYPIEWQTSRFSLPRGRYTVDLEVAVVPNGQYQQLFSVTALTDFAVEGETPGELTELSGRWGVYGVENLGWRKGKDHWFFQHFEHAARTIIYYMLDDSPLLTGKILDVGCGDGITDLGVFLRKRPQLLVGIDMEGHFRELPRMLQENGLKLDPLPENLIFREADANQIPYPDDYFDVVLSWASLEHFAGGYWQALREIKRVLKDGGLFFLHPGLYYSNLGHHLGEFTSAPFVHLNKSPEELRQIVFTAQPHYADRGGLMHSPADFWRYYTELNTITVAKLERELRQLNFEFKKVAVRAEDLVNYTPALQKYSIQDLTTGELYLTAVNRKTPLAAEKRERAAFAGNPGSGEPFDYAHYELQLRYTKYREWNRELLVEYVPYFAECQRVLDLACGSGIFLELLAEKRIPAIGVERNKTVAEWVQTQGLEVVWQDAFEFLAQSRETYDGIFCSHFIEHLPFDRVVRLIELIIPRLEPGGTLVLVFPNPESIRMQLFGFWRDPEHIRFYHPELIETVCRHYGLTIVQTNREAIPFAVSPPSWETLGSGRQEEVQGNGKGGLREIVRDTYRGLLRTLRLVPRVDLVALEERLRREGEERLRQERVALQQLLAPWTGKATEAINRMWAWADNALIVCRKEGR